MSKPDICPGIANIRTPTLQIRHCPDCEAEVEVFSTDTDVGCNHCGFVIYNDLASCIQWCKYARDCVGEDTYQKFKKQVMCPPEDSTCP